MLVTYEVYDYCPKFRPTYVGDVSLEVKPGTTPPTFTVASTGRAEYGLKGPWVGVRRKGFDEPIRPQEFVVVSLGI